MFIQILHFRTHRSEGIQHLVEEWEHATEGKRTARRSIVTHAADDPTFITVIVFFDSPESAAENSALPETQQFAAALNTMVYGGTAFHDLIVTDDKTY